MLSTKKKVTLWAVAEALITYGLVLVALGVGLIETDIGTLKQGAGSIGIGAALIVFGIVIYAVKSKYGIPEKEE